MNFKVKLLLSAAATASIAVAAPAFAQETARDSGTEAGEDGAIIVTATKSGKSLEDTGGSISVLGAGDVGAGGIEDAGDLASAVPNVSVGDQFGVNRTFIRGIGLTSIDLGADGAVAFLQNGAMISRPAAQLSGFYDVQQIEVLRGPQGTTYGRGATGGVINIVTARPTSQFGGYARATYGNYDARTLEGALGGPITGENLMFRVAGKYEKRDGYGTNLFTGNPVDDRDAHAIRGSLLAKLSSNLDLLIVADHFKEDDNNYAFHYFGPTVVPEAGLASSLLGGKTIFDYYAARGEKPNLRNIYSDEDAVNKRDGSSVQGILTWDLGISRWFPPPPTASSSASIATISTSAISMPSVRTTIPRTASRSARRSISLTRPAACRFWAVRPISTNVCSARCACRP